MKNNVILVDCDGVLCDWETAFDSWMTDSGYHMIHGGSTEYDIDKRYGIPRSQSKELVKTFNESEVIELLPPLRDAVKYVKLLHEVHGYVFHCITSLSNNETAYRRRKNNLEKLFGKNVFEKLICLDVGADKDDVLKTYQNSELWWIEDKWQNCISGLNAGLKPILMIHGHNRDYQNPNIKTVENWHQIFNTIIA